MRKSGLYICCLLTFLICSATSCDDEDICHSESDKEATLKAFQLFHLDNTGRTPVTPTDGKVKKEVYMLRIQLEADAAVDAHCWLTNQIAYVDIFTVNDFNSDYPADSRINDCFDEYPLNLEYKVVDRTMHKNSNVIEEMFYRDNICCLPGRKGNLYKVLKTLPDPGDHQFHVVLTFDNMETMELTTEVITLY